MTTLSKARVLLIEDDPVDAAVVRGFLAPHDIGCLDVVEELEEALLRAHAGGYHVILFDLDLPSKLGGRAISALKIKDPTAYRVVYTREPDPDFDEYFEAGADAYRRKGDSVDSLLSAIVKGYRTSTERRYRALRATGAFQAVDTLTEQVEAVCQRARRVSDQQAKPKTISEPGVGFVR